MVDINNIDISDKLSIDVDRKICISCLKAKGKKMLTCIKGLENFFNNEEIKNIANNVKKTLGTGGSEKQIELNKKNIIIQTFNGDHKNEVKNI